MKPKLTDDNKYAIVIKGVIRAVFELVFYRDKSGKSPLVDYLDGLKDASTRDKNARINRQKILAYMAALSRYGTRLGEPFVKHIDGDIWELRPLKNRIFFFYWRDNRFVLLNHFLKRSQKTPKSEINKAKSLMKDFLKRSDEV